MRQVLAALVAAGMVGGAIYARDHRPATVAHYVTVPATAAMSDGPCTAHVGPDGRPGALDLSGDTDHVPWAGTLPVAVRVTYTDGRSQSYRCTVRVGP